MDTELSQLIVFRNRVEKGIINLEDRVRELSQRLFQSDSIGEQQRILLQLSVTEGVHSMMSQYYSLAKQKVEKKTHLQTTEVNSSDSHTSTEEDRANNSRTDKAATLWTNTFCEYHRYS